MRKFLKLAFVAAFAAIAGYGVYTSQKSDSVSDLMLANVEALAQSETGREDCVSASDMCSELVIYPDGYWGEDILMDHTKRPGWL